MIYITQLIYIKEGQEKIFDEFEEVAIPLIAKYNGKLLFRLRPNKDSFIETWIDKPYEIHLVEFDSEQDYKNFMKSISISFQGISRLNCVCKCNKGFCRIFNPPIHILAGEKVCIHAIMPIQFRSVLASWQIA